MDDAPTFIVLVSPPAKETDLNLIISPMTIRTIPIKVRAIWSCKI